MVAHARALNLLTISKVCLIDPEKTIDVTPTLLVLKLFFVIEWPTLWI